MKKIIIGIFLGTIILGCVTSQFNFEEYKQKAHQGDPKAQAEVGYRYQYGDGITKDSQQALKWNLKAANQGNAMAQHNLAVMYDEGVDIPENNNEAIVWYKKAAEQGHPSAQLNLGIMYWNGEGVTKDLEQAWKLLNTVRISSSDKRAKWAARGALDEIKKEIDANTGPYDYPKWEDLQKAVK